MPREKKEGEGDWLEEIAGPATRKKLEELGVASPEHLVEFTVDELVEAGVEPSTAERVLAKARELTGRRPRALKASELAAQKYKAVKTGVAQFDEKTPWGGLREGFIYEFAGEFGAGKSMLAHQIAVKSAVEGFGDVVYIDTEGTANPSLMGKMAKRFGGEASALDKIYVHVPDNVTGLELFVKYELPRHLAAGARVIVVDTITALYRAEFVGRESLAERQQRLHYLIDWFRRHSRVYGALVVFTNQVLDVPEAFAAGVKRPAGGNVLAHTVNARFMMARPSKQRLEGYMWALDVPGMSPEERIGYEIRDDGLY
ncbi:MAG: ATPase domain-containing protein [Thermoproteus sp. AZ2]|uniref:ATPase domain-containing protein n=1 Tax=Thermoproteus sp. AZ2 TaxID=1609232 RepID=A0ACC6V2M4_9CREN